mmetsp:Transcript_16867/g.28009  ORF Transcript_16867/g.28009 Transcript_16867/m.28009 type:complete len:151 (-) Transcript_16867:113-565(-)
MGFRYRLSLAMLIVLMLTASTLMRILRSVNDTMTLSSSLNAAMEALVWDPLAPIVNISIEILETMDYFCNTWEAMNLDEWWTHRIDYVVAKENSTHQCFRHDNRSKRALFLKRVYANQFDSNSCYESNVYVRYLWGSGWGEFLFLLAGLP